MLRFAAILCCGLLIAAFLVKNCSAQTTASYLRVRVNPQTIIYAKFQNAEMRLASTVQGLKSARPIKMIQSYPDEIEFPEVDLPIPAKAIPAGFHRLRTCFVTYAPSGSYSSDSNMVAGYTYGHFAFVRKDSSGKQWNYLVKMRSKTSPSPNSAPTVTVPVPQNLKLVVQAQPKGRMVGVGVKLMAGKAQLLDILKGSAGSEVKVRIINSAGHVVGSRSATIENFGYTWDEPRYSTMVKAPGQYTCEAIMNGGPMCPVLKGTTKVVVK